MQTGLVASKVAGDHSLLYAFFSSSLIPAARYASNNGDFQGSASKLSFALVNVRAILTHFSPKIDEFLTSQNISTPTEEQVCY